MLTIVDRIKKIIYSQKRGICIYQIPFLFWEWSINLKKTTPKNMATAGRISGLVIQALRYMGQENVDDRGINILKRKLADKDKKTLMTDLRYAPAWIDKVVRRLSEE